MPTCPSDMLRPMTRGSLCGGSRAARMVRMPFIRPAMARPTISMGNDYTAPQSAEPSSKVVKKTKKDH